MAARPVETLDLLIVFGQKKLPVVLDLANVESGASCLNLRHLSEAVHRETLVEPSCQKIIYKGRTLFKPDDIGGNAMETSLLSLGIRSGHRMMVLGRKAEKKAAKAEKKAAKAVEEIYDPMAEIRAKVDKMVARFDYEMETLGNLNELEDLKFRKKSFLHLNEDSMKLLELIDSTTALNDDERKHRKLLVNKIQGKMDMCEDCIDNLSKKIRVLEQKKSDNR